jgi:TetR/AcrR family transcriptional regulator, tetracycline repressor protein
MCYSFSMRIKVPKRPALQPEKVVQVALELLDDEGLEGVTLRRLATRLGVQSPALYWHFKNKQDLLDDMAQAILSSASLTASTPPSDPTAWEPWLRQMAHALRQVLLSRREGARVVAGAGPGRARALAELTERTIHVLHTAGFALLVANFATITLKSYTFGFVIEEQAGMPALSELPESLDDLALQFPMLIAIFKTRGTSFDTDSFDHGLQIILQGLRLQY